MSKIKTHCINGHLYTPENTYIAPKTGAKGCLVCRREKSRRFQSSNHNNTARREYLFGGNRELAIQRDGERCVKCGMSREEHRALYNRDITVDHIDGRGVHTAKENKNNALSNLMTLCLHCHGIKDNARRTDRKLRLTLEDARDIRLFRAAGMRAKDIHKAYQMVSYSTIVALLNNRIHKEYL